MYAAQIRSGSGTENRRSSRSGAGATPAILRVVVVRYRRRT